jgi:hypothetical protein
LIADSELNRDQLSEEWHTMTHGVRDLVRRAETIGAWVLAAVLLVAGVTALRRGPSAPGAAKSSWFPKLLHGARRASAIWFAFRARGEENEHK